MLSTIIYDDYEYIKSKESSARTYASTFQRSIKSGNGCTLYDTNGKEYLDFLAGAGSLPLGHNFTPVVEALKCFLDTDAILNGLDFSTPIKANFIQKIFECLPEKMRETYKIQFCGPTGSDAVDAAMKLFKIYNKRSNIIAFHGAYHGVGQGPLAITGDSNSRSGISSLMSNSHFMPSPYYYKYNGELDKETYEKTIVEYIGSVFDDPNSGIDKPAAMIIEAVQGEGGCIPISKFFLKKIREITIKHNIPLIIDEVQTGFGRTGKMFAFEHSEIVPDAIVVSKAVGGGLPMAAVLYDKKYDTWQPGAHAGTFRGNQLAMVSGKVTLEHINNEMFLESVKEKGKYIIVKLNSILSDSVIIGDIRGLGLMIGIELSKDISRDIVTKLSKSIKAICFENGLIIETGGRSGAVLRLLPPLNVSYEEIERAIQILYNSIQKVEMEYKNEKVTYFS